MRSDTEHTVDVIISTVDMDRDREVVMPRGMRMLGPKRLPLVSSHNYHQLMKHIGTWERVRPDDEQITARARYFAGLGNPEADWGWQLVMLGVSAYSIGFIPFKWTDADLNDEKVLAGVRARKIPLRVYDEWELVEASHVVVPSNRGAVQATFEDAAAKGLITTDEQALLGPLWTKSEDARGAIVPPALQAGVITSTPVVTDPPAAEPRKAVTVPEARAFVDDALKALLDAPASPAAAPEPKRALTIHQVLHFDLPKDGVDLVHVHDPNGDVVFADTPAAFVAALLTEKPIALRVEVDAASIVTELQEHRDATAAMVAHVQAELTKQIPNLPTDSVAFVSLDALAGVLLRVIDQRIDRGVAAVIGKHLGNIDQWPAHLRGSGPA